MEGNDIGKNLDGDGDGNVSNQRMGWNVLIYIKRAFM